MTTEFDLELLKKLGAMTKALRKEISSMPKKGMNITQLIDHIEKKIFEAGYIPAFPCTVSVNDIAAHYTVFSDDEHILDTGDLIKIDFGISHNGFITDNAVTIEIETNKYEELMKANLEALNEVMQKVQIGTSMSELGETVRNVATKYGFETIHNLSGHQIAKHNLHCGLSVPNYANNDTRQVQENMQFAIEPFFTQGEPKIKSAGPSNIVHLINDKPVRDPIAKKVLEYVKEFYPHLPFSKRWLIKDVIEKLSSDEDRVKKAFDKKRVMYALRVLKQHNILYEYDALGSVDGSYISQYEDCVVFTNNTKTIITREE